MKNLKSKEDLIEIVTEQIKIDVDCGDYQAIEELVSFCPVENLIHYLPEWRWKEFRHLKEEEVIDLINQFPNDTDLGKEIRKKYGRSNKH